MSLFFMISFLLKSVGVVDWYAFTLCRPSLKVKTPWKNTYWKDKFLRLPTSIDIQTKWNLNPLQDKLGSFETNHASFKKLEGAGVVHILSGKFEEATLVRAGLSQTPSDDDTSDDSK